MRIERCFAFVLSGLLVGAAAFGISADPPVATPPAASAPTPFEKTIRAYRSTPVAETVQIRVKDASGAERRSTVEVRIDSGDERAGRPRSALLELGPLSLWVHGNRLLATPKHEGTRFVEFELVPGPLVPALAKHVPAILLPQLTLGDGAVEEFGDLGLLPNPAPVRWDAPVVDRVTGKTIFNGEGGDAKFKVMADRSSGRLSSVQVTYASGPLRLLELLIRSIDPGTPESWAITTDGRRKVDSLAELQKSSDTLRVGELYPFDASVVTIGIQLWSGRPGLIPIALVFVKLDTAGFSESDPDRRDSAFNAATRAASPAVSIVRDLSKKADGRWLARSVAVIDPADLRVPITTSLLTVLNPTDSSVVADLPNAPLFTTPEVLDLDRVFAGKSTVVVVLDKSRFVRGIFPVSGHGEPGDDATQAEVKARALLESLK